METLLQIFFVDESGTPPAKPSAANKYFVLGGLVIPEAQWHGIADEFDSLRSDYKVWSELKWRHFGSKMGDPKSPIKNLDLASRDDLRTRIFQIIAKRKSVKVICSVASVEAAYEVSKVKNADDLYALTYKTISERFQYLLQDQTRDVGRKEFGIVVLDQRNRKNDRELRRVHEGLIDDSGPFTSSYGNFIENLFLAPSHHSVGIQLADMVAGAVYRHFNSGDSRWFNLIKNSFRKSGDGRIEGYGLVKVPKRNWR